ncbi:hypothetical protein HPB50_028529 [Hyalomma asiaticum]|nr:hypothetical protein HPB50_028529 [Hyalomma asiaticum]
MRRMQTSHADACDAKFADAGPTVEFMKNMCRWFTLMDVSNCQQHIHQNHPDTKEFYDPEDSRLHWLELVFLEYIEDLKATSAPQNFLSKETHHALVFTTVSNVQCIRFLLHRGFKFVLTRKFSSDPIESLFGTLRRSAGCNDMLDVRSALSGLEKMLKTGIVAASSTSNVHSSSSFFSSGNIIVSGKPSSMSSTSAAASSKRSAAATVNSAQQLLRELCTSTKPFLPTPDMAAISLVAGYISRVVTEKIECGRCMSSHKGKREQYWRAGRFDRPPRQGYEAGWKTAGARRSRPRHREADLANDIDARTNALGTGQQGAKSKNVKGKVIKAGRMPKLPKEEIKIVVRPQGGLEIVKVGVPTVTAAIFAAAGITAEGNDVGSANRQIARRRSKTTRPSSRPDPVPDRDRVAGPGPTAGEHAAVARRYPDQFPETR